jgi:hypothetical protein
MLQLFLLTEGRCADGTRVAAQPQMYDADVTVEGGLKTEVLKTVDAVEGAPTPRAGRT